MFLDGKSSEEYPVNTGVPEGSILVPTLFLQYVNEVTDDVICDIAIYADDTILYSNNYNLLLNLKVVPATFLLVCFLSVNKSTCQTRKNAFYFTSKALFFLEKIKF